MLHGKRELFEEEEPLGGAAVGAFCAPDLSEVTKRIRRGDVVPESLEQRETEILFFKSFGRSPATVEVQAITNCPQHPPNRSERSTQDRAARAAVSAQRYQWACT
jgi:hypothetical protein